MQYADSLEVTEDLVELIKTKKLKELIDTEDIEELMMNPTEYDRARKEYFLDLTADTFREWYEENGDREELLGWLNELSLDLLVYRGDLIETIPSEERYRNTGTFIYDGDKVIGLDYEEYTDYGAPPKYLVDEFGTEYWNGVLGYNVLQHYTRGRFE